MHKIPEPPSRAQQQTRPCANRDGATFGIRFSQNHFTERDGALSMKKNCRTCKWGEKGSGVMIHEVDIVCVNGNSERCTNFVSEYDSCALWEAGMR